MKPLIDVWSEKKLSLKIGKDVVKVGHLPAHLQLKHLKDISSSFYLLNLLAKEEERVIDLPTCSKTDKPYKHELKALIEASFTNEAMPFLIAYHACIKKVWALVRYFVPWYKRFLVKRKFYQQAMGEMEWLLNFVNEIYNYWLYLGKRMGLLASQQTPEMTPSQDYLMPSLSMVMGIKKSSK